MADFNIKVGDAGYTPRPAMIGKVYNNNTQQALLGLLQDVVGSATKKLLAKNNEDPNLEPALKEYREATIENANLDSMTPEQRSSQVMTEGWNTAESAYKTAEKDFEAGLINEEQFTNAAKEADKMMNVAKVKSDQLGSKFDFKQEQFKAYDRIARKYGEKTALTVFQSMQSGNPSNFVTTELVERRHEAMAKMAEANQKTIEEEGKALGMLRRIGETDLDYGERITATKSGIANARSLWEQHQIYTDKVNRLEIGANEAKPYLANIEGQMLGELSKVQTTQIDSLLVGFNPANATKEGRLAYEQRLETYRRTEEQNILSRMTNNESARNAALDALNKKVGFAREVVSGKLEMDTLGYHTKIKNLQALSELQDNVKDFEVIRALDEIKMLQNNNALFGVELSSLLAHRTGRQIVSYFVGSNAEGGTPFSNVTAAEFKKFNAEVLSLASKYPEFGKLMRLSGVKALQASIDFSTGEVKDPAAMAGSMDLIGSQEFLKYIYPQAADKYGSRGMQIIYNEAVSGYVKAVGAQLAEADGVRNVLSKAKTGEGNMVVMDIHPGTGDVLLGYVEGGEVKYFQGQDNNPDVRRARLGLGAAMRSLSHLKGKQNYDEEAQVLLDGLGYSSNSGTVRFVTRSAWESQKKASEKND